MTTGAHELATMSRPPSPSLSPELEPLVQASTRDDDNESVGGVDGTLTPPSGNSSPFDDDFARENPAPAKTAKTDVWGFYSYSFAVEVCSPALDYSWKRPDESRAGVCGGVFDTLPAYVVLREILTRTEYRLQR